MAKLLTAYSASFRVEEEYVDPSGSDSGSTAFCLPLAFALNSLHGGCSSSPESGYDCANVSNVELGTNNAQTYEQIVVLFYIGVKHSNGIGCERVFDGNDERLWLRAGV
jgi:hypothetical protein